MKCDCLAFLGAGCGWGRLVLDIGEAWPVLDTLTVSRKNERHIGAALVTVALPQVQAIARQLNHLNPDIVTLNEIPNSLRHEMTNWMIAFFPTYHRAVSPGTDGALRNGVISRYSITRSNSWLERASFTNFGYNGVVDPLAGSKGVGRSKVFLTPLT